MRAPVPTLRNIQLTPEDEQDLRHVQPFVLTTGEIGEYDIRYLGKQNADEIPCYVFAVKPKKMVQGKRYFEGQIWVDDRDLQIVKTYGKGVGLLKKGSDNQFPKFETYREQVDGKYWFPTYTTANDTLHFQSGPQRIKMTVKYEDYKRFEGRSTIQFGDVVEENSAHGRATGRPAEEVKRTVRIPDILFGYADPKLPLLILVLSAIGAARSKHGSATRCRFPTFPAIKRSSAIFTCTRSSPTAKYGPPRAWRKPSATAWTPSRSPTTPATCRTRTT